MPCSVLSLCGQESEAEASGKESGQRMAGVEWSLGGPPVQDLVEKLPGLTINGILGQL